jgi:hypothetical protein
MKSAWKTNFRRDSLGARLLGNSFSDPGVLSACRSGLEGVQQAIKEWIPDDEPDLNWFNQARPSSDSEPDQFDQSPAWQPEEVSVGDGRTLILEDSWLRSKRSQIAAAKTILGIAGGRTTLSDHEF